MIRLFAVESKSRVLQTPEIWPMALEKIPGLKHVC